MKSLLFVSLLSLSVSAFAGILKTDEVLLNEVQDQKVTDNSCTDGDPSCGVETVQPVLVGSTKMVVASQVDMIFQIHTTETTRWSSGAQLIDVRNLQLTYGGQNGRGAQVVIYQADGNNMGIIETHLTMNCTKETEVIHCTTTLPNKNKLGLLIGR